MPARPWRKPTSASGSVAVFGGKRVAAITRVTARSAPRFGGCVIPHPPRHPARRFSGTLDPLCFWPTGGDNAHEHQGPCPPAGSRDGYATHPLGTLLAFNLLPISDRTVPRCSRLARPPAPAEPSDSHAGLFARCRKAEASSSSAPSSALVQARTRPRRKSAWIRLSRQRSRPAQRPTGEFPLAVRLQAHL